MTKNTSVARTQEGAFYSASQLRLDAWHRLKHIAAQLSELSQEGGDCEPLLDHIRQILQDLAPIEMYWAFPSEKRFFALQSALDRREFEPLSQAISHIVRSIVSASYRRRKRHSRDDENADPTASIEPQDWAVDSDSSRPYFEILVVDQISADGRYALREGLLDKQQPDDPFVYDILVVPSFGDALIAASLNAQIQAVILGPDFRTKSRNTLSLFARSVHLSYAPAPGAMTPVERSMVLAERLGEYRPEIDVYMVSDASVEAIAGNCPSNIRRVFYHLEDSIDLHLNIIRGIKDRYKTPFFSALKEYSKQPTGVFHAMPISRGKSIQRSNWIRDMGEFYGMNIFLAETSATSGGLDSLLEPKGPLKSAQVRAARAFHAERTYFATNGTSTCNKIVVQALVKPGDIVLVDRDCHKSHHYGLVLVGAEVMYLDSYALDKYSMYGAVPLATIKRALLNLKAADKLERVKMLLLTNCTFDGLVYNVEQVMEQCLAIKPDLVFLWDEAWFAFAAFAPTYRVRTAMWTAARLKERYQSAEYRERYETWLKTENETGNDAMGERHLMPDPDKVRVRVYACQSTHKTLTALRQGSMIHVHDQDFLSKSRDAFHEAYMTHTSTSPNYQILASLDLGRRQVELEGYELVQKQIEMAMVLRERITTHPLISKWFSVLTAADLVPESYRRSGIDDNFDLETGWSRFDEAWSNDEFVLDPTRITLFIGHTGVDGDSFKNKHLMDKHGIQINKTSRNTVLFMTNIGTTRSSVAYLIEVLVKIARELDTSQAALTTRELSAYKKRILSLTEFGPPLPHFSHFHEAFQPPASTTGEGNMRRAFFLAYDGINCEHLSMDEIDSEIDLGRDVVAAIFVIPYPPGFPILVPGQVISKEIMQFMRELDVKEIHGFEEEVGIRVFTADTMNKELTPA